MVVNIFTPLAPSKYTVAQWRPDVKGVYTKMPHKILTAPLTKMKGKI